MKHAQALRAKAQEAGLDRRERAEVESLRSALEKTKADAEAARRKARASERRLQQTCREQSEKISQLEEQLEFLERQRVEMWTQSLAASGGNRKSSHEEGASASSQASVDAAGVAGVGGVRRKASVSWDEASYGVNGHYQRKQQYSGDEGLEADKMGVVDDLEVLEGEAAYGYNVIQHHQESEGLQVFHNHSSSGRERALAAKAGRANAADLTAGSWGLSLPPDRPSSRHSEGRSRSQNVDSPSDSAYDPLRYSATSLDYGYSYEVGQVERTSGPAGGQLSLAQLAGGTVGHQSIKEQTSAASPTHDFGRLRDSVEVQAAGTKGNRSLGMREGERVEWGRRGNDVALKGAGDRGNVADSTATGTTNGATAEGHSPVVTQAHDKLEQLHADGRKTTWFKNGTQKELLPDGSSFVRFANGDVKQTLSSGVVVYTYAEAKTAHTTYPSGLEMFEFPNGQVERHHEDGRKEIDFPDGTKKYVSVDGTETSVFPDGIRVVEHEGCQIITTPKGTTHREWPDM
ncbi:unnamed protein product [Chrysoparadoxa australica]